MTPLPFFITTNLHLQAEIESWTKIQGHYFCKIAWAIVEDSSWLILFKIGTPSRKLCFFHQNFPNSVSLFSSCLAVVNSNMNRIRQWFLWRMKKMLSFGFNNGYKPTTLKPIISFLSYIPYALETSLMFSWIHHSLYSRIFILTWPVQL